MKNLDETLRSLTEEDRGVLKDLLSSALGEENPKSEREALTQLAENTEGFVGDGVMTIQAHKVYKDATGESLIQMPVKKEKETERWGGKDSKLIEEWKDRNRERQNEGFKRLLKRRG